MRAEWGEGGGVAVKGWRGGLGSGGEAGFGELEGGGGVGMRGCRESVMDGESKGG